MPSYKDFGLNISVYQRNSSILFYLRHTGIIIYKKQHNDSEIIQVSPCLSCIIILNLLSDLTSSPNGILSLFNSPNILKVSILREKIRARCLLCSDFENLEICIGKLD
jgi:hypothetical protein